MLTRSPGRLGENVLTVHFEINVYCGIQGILLILGLSQIIQADWCWAPYVVPVLWGAFTCVLGLGLTSQEDDNRCEGMKSPNTL